MRIAVLVKQVPAVDRVKIDEATGTMVRDGVEAELNPPDLHALEAALQIKESCPQESVEIQVVTMGPATARKAIAHGIAMGCDGGVLISDRSFGGSDTLATSRVLAQALKKFGPFDLVLAGERATDGETGQVGPAVAQLLGLSALTYVTALESLDQGTITVLRAVEEGFERVRAPLPAMVIPVKAMNRPRFGTLGGVLRARAASVAVCSAADLGLPASELGLKGSPTQVASISYPKVTRQCRRIMAQGQATEAAEELLKILEEKNCLEALR